MLNFPGFTRDRFDDRLGTLTSTLNCLRWLLTRSEAILRRRVTLAGERSFRIWILGFEVIGRFVLFDRFCLKTAFATT
jgi:hypothetical protein